MARMTAAAAAVLVLSLLAALPLGFALGATEAEIEALGPEAASPAEHRLARSLRRFSPMAQALWPPVLRLQRTWREHAARGEGVRMVLAHQLLPHGAQLLAVGGAWHAEDFVWVRFVGTRLKR